MSVPKRSIRRHHAERLKKNRKGYWADYKKTPRHLGILLNNPCVCSCWMCRNKRWLYGPTMQELRQPQLLAA